MTFPNRPNYTPGEQRRVPKCVVSTKVTPMMPKKMPQRSLGGKAAEVETKGMQQDLQVMLAALSPAHGDAAAPQSNPTKEESLAFVEQSHKRLLADETFQGNESYQDLLTLAKNTAVKALPDVVDPFAKVIEQMPASPSYQDFGATNDELSGSDTSRSQFMEAISLQTMARATNGIVEDPTVRARYEHAAHKLHEWGERRMQQVQPQLSPETTLNDSKSLPSLSLSLAGISPYAMELAARNSLPKKRSSLSKLAKKLMHDWFEHNLHHPYPTEEEKEWLAGQGGITLEQVNNWFINTRGRKWKPMLNRLMAEKQAGDCKLYDQMVEKIEEPYHRF